MDALFFESIGKHIQLTSEEIEITRGVLQYKKLRRRQYLLQQGDVCRYETFITKGCLRAYTVDDKGDEHIVMFGVEGWWISDFYSLLTGSPSTQNIDALEDSELLCIEKSELDKLYTRVPKFERLFRILLQNAFIANQQRILSSISMTAEEKYLAFVTKYPTIEQRVPQTQIASYLGITPETISRIRKGISR